MLLRSKKIDTGIEQKILIGMIVSDKFLRETIHLTDLIYFQNPFISRVADWCLNHYDTYKSAPKQHIQDVYDLERPNINAEEIPLIEALLTKISTDYAQNSEGLNEDYLIDEATNFYKTRELEIVSNNIKVLIERGDIKGAEDELFGFKKIERLHSESINPFTEEALAKVFEEKNKVFFQLPGDLGKFIGPLEKGWLIGIAGPFKRGKTTYCQEIGIQGALCGKKVWFVSLEMSEKKMTERLNQRLTALGKKHGDIKFPCFDCELNKINSCTNENRSCRVGRPEEFRADQDYVPCTWCREHDPFEYKVDHWYEIVHKEEMTFSEMNQTMIPIRKVLKDNFRIKTYPKMSANVQDIKRDHQILVQIHGFVPEIIIIDMVDNLKSENKGQVGVEKEDANWMALAGLGEEVHALILTPTQLTKDSISARNITSQHNAKWIGKLGHVDGMLALNQLPEEKKEGVMRVSWMIRRHDEYDEMETCTVLQSIAFGQSHLDSYWKPTLEEY